MTTKQWSDTCVELTGSRAELLAFFEDKGCTWKDVRWPPTRDAHFIDVSRGLKRIARIRYGRGGADVQYNPKGLL